MNLRLAAYLAWRSLHRHPTVGLATVLGVTLGMVVIATILIVDTNSSEQPRTEPRPLLLSSEETGGGPATAPQRILRVWFERGPETETASAAPFPTQVGSVREGVSAAAPPAPRGEEDYQTMRLAVRLAAVLAFGVGAVIVFYTMRFSVASRTRELSLLLCLGEERRNLALSLTLEALLLGATGALLGLALAFPAATALLEAGISTTGRVPSRVFQLPWPELGAIGGLSLCIALLGVVGPIRSFYRLRVAEVLQPRFLGPDEELRSLRSQGFAWLLPALATAAWLAMRPFLQGWLSVVQFFLLEILVVGLVVVATLWWVRPLLRGVVRLAEACIRPLLPLDALLVGRRMRLTSHKLVFTVAAVTLVFSLLTALHDVTRALKHEIRAWAADALYPNVFFERSRHVPPDRDALELALEQRRIRILRLSKKVGGELPVRLVRSDDLNPLRKARGEPPLVPGTAILSRTLAARFDVQAGHRLVIGTGQESHRFEIVEVTDRVGYYAEDGQYVDLKSYVLFSDGNPLFADNLERSLGDYLVAAKTDHSYFSEADVRALGPYYLFDRRGAAMAHWQIREIDRDFLIFDFVLAMTVALAAIGVTNTILIQVHAREREFAVLRTLGVSRGQTARLLLVEGAVIGLVSALLALVLGNLIGAVSVSFLDRFTLFHYELVLSPGPSLAITGLALVTCCLAALYPALVANRISSAESLHYE